MSVVTFRAATRSPIPSPRHPALMNRISAVPFPPQSSASLTRNERKPVATLSRQDSSHSLLAPLHYESNYAYPLLVWLHGPGGSERELVRVMPLVSLRNYVSLAVRGPADEHPGYSWPQTVDSIQTAELRIAEAIAVAQRRFNLHPERVFLCGAGNGGTMAIRLALRRPDLYAGAASLGGPFPDGHAPLARLKQARRVRLLIEHPRDSVCYPIERVCRELALFHAAGMSVTLRQYPCPDELTTQMLHDLDVWLMEQVTGVAAEEQEHVPLPSDWN